MRGFSKTHTVSHYRVVLEEWTRQTDGTYEWEDYPIQSNTKEMAFRKAQEFINLDPNKFKFKEWSEVYHGTPNNPNFRRPL